MDWRLHPCLPRHFQEDVGVEKRIWWGGVESNPSQNLLKWNNVNYHQLVWSCDQLDIYEGREAQWLAQQSKQTSAEEKRFVVENAFLGFFWPLSCHETCTVRCRVAHLFVFLTENMSPGLLPFCPKVKNLRHPSLHLISESIFTCLKHALGVSERPMTSTNAAPSFTCKSLCTRKWNLWILFVYLSDVNQSLFNRDLRSTRYLLILHSKQTCISINTNCEYWHQTLIIN